MKKVSKASFISAIVLIVAAIVLNVIGFTYINGVRVVRQTGYGFMHMAYYTDSSMTNTCFAMIIAGGFLFVGGILLFMLSVMTRCPGKKCCHDHKGEAEVKQVEAPKADEKPAEAQPAEECKCCEETPSEEQNQSN